MDIRNMSREAGSGFAGKKILVLTLGILLVAAACNKSTQTNNSDQQNAGNQTSDQGQPLSGEATIEVSSHGFTPNQITVKAGTKVIFKNTDTALHWPASDPHPTHTDLPGFDALQGLKQGQSYTYTFDKIGRWKFHDHLNSGQRGQVTVVQ